MEPVSSRHSIRLTDYNYASAGSYFITICTQHKEHRFGHISDDEMLLNDAGKLIEERIQAIPNRFGNTLIDSYVVMPNHVHFIITLLEYVPVTRLNGNDVLDVTHVGAAHRGRPLSDANAAADTPDVKNDVPGMDVLNSNHGSTSGHNGPKAGGHDGPPLQDRPKPSLADIIGWFKASATNYYIRGVKEGRFPPFDRRLWQRNYYEHIIQTNAAYTLIDEYIQTNPLRWAEDRLRE